MPYVLALCAAFMAAAGAAFQDREVSAVSEDQSKGWRLIWASLKRPKWILGLVVMTAAPVFQYLALRVGNLAQVQPMLTTELLFLLAVIVVTHHGHPGLREWTGALGIVIGLGMLLVAADPHGGQKYLTHNWALVMSGCVVVLVSGFYLASQFVTGWIQAAFLGAAAATCFAYQAAMTQVIAGVGVGQIISTPALYGLAIGGLLGFVLFQHALRAGHVAASRASMVIVDPLLSALIGVVAFHDVMNTKALNVAFEVIGLILLILGAQRLATSPLLAEVHGPLSDQAMTL